MSKSDYIFISHSSEDRKLATALCHFLEKKGLQCWITPRDISPGKDYAQAIIEAIHMSSVMILVFTKYANNSKHVKNEVERGFSKQLVIIPFRVENIIPASSLEYFLSSTHWLDAFEGKPESYFEEVYKNCFYLLNKKTEEIPATVNVTPAREPGKKNKTVFWLIAICVVALAVFYFTNKKSSVSDQVNKIAPDSTSPIHADSSTATHTDTNHAIPAAMDTAKHDPGKVLIQDKEPEKTPPVPKKVIKEKKDNEIAETEGTKGTQSLSVKTDEELESVNGTTYEASNSTDDLMFTALPKNKLSFTGSIDEYSVSGKLKPLGNKNYVVVESSNTKGTLKFSENNDIVSGTFYIKSSEPSHGFKLAKKQ